MTEQAKPQHLTPWCCPQCGADCSGTQDQLKESGDVIGYFLTCACGCEFIHWETQTCTPYCVELADGTEYEYPQEVNPADVSSFVEEYKSLADLGEDDDKIAEVLHREHDWTGDTADELVELARRYGWFILRNALALAIALDIEDGSEGL